MDESAIRQFWNSDPSGQNCVGGVDSYRADPGKFFADYDRFRYASEPHLPACLDGLDVAGRRVLEIGFGQGTDAERLIRRGARWSGLELAPEFIERARTRLRLRGLAFDEVCEGSVLSLPWPDASFDMVFSHGVLHCVPEIHRAQAEIHRVLRPGGELVVMLYAKRSLNYLVSIAILRRLGLALVYATGAPARGKIAQHVANARAMGLARYLRMENFIHPNTDTPRNPYSKVYDLATVRADFPDFEIIRHYKRNMHAPPLPVHGLPFGRLMGWHLWVHLRPR
ncbi:MAG: class I SAM-dependent methyltransferase [Gammaproteobacteria bacterium]